MPVRRSPSLRTRSFSRLFAKTRSLPLCSTRLRTQNTDTEQPQQTNGTRTRGYAPKQLRRPLKIRRQVLVHLDVPATVPRTPTIVGLDHACPVERSESCTWPDRAVDRRIERACHQLPRRAVCQLVLAIVHDLVGPDGPQDLICCDVRVRIDSSRTQRSSP